jgi:uncharacterized protein YjbI with pentapeptide repeats
MFEVNEKKLRKELAEARRRLNRDPQYLLYIEPVGRCLRWLDDPESEVLFTQAAAQLSAGISQSRARTRKLDPYSLLTLGNYYRLAGDQTRAREVYERAHSSLGPPDEVPRSMADYERKVILAFLLGRDEEVVQLLALAWGREKDPWLDSIAVVSDARLSENAALADEAAEAVAELIRRHRIRASDGPFDLHPWDQYELTLRAKAKLEGRADDAALPAPELLRRERELAESGVRRQETQAPRKRLTRAQVQEILEESEEDQDLTAVDLSGMDFAGEHFTNALLVDSDLRDVNFSNAVFVETNMQGADLSGANLHGALLQQAILSGANLDGVRLNLVENKNLTYVDLSKTNLQGFDLSGMDLRMADLSEANLRGANLSGADLRRTDLTGADLTGANLQGANLEGADLERAIMDGTSW